MGTRILAAAVAAWLAAVAPAAAQDDAPVGERIVGDMVKLFGDHPGVRVNHTKGIVVEGTFTPTGAGAKLSTASLFEGAPTPLIARFSDATGVPDIADGAANANPHGMGLRFSLADGGEFDIVANSLPFFPVKTAEDFLALLDATIATTPDTPKPTPVEQFIAAHPTVLKAVGALKTPTSFGREIYNGVNAFVFVDAAGERHPFRFRIVPVAGAEHLSPEDAAKQPADFLVEGIKADLAKGPVRFRLLAQMAAAGDDTSDPSVPWPEDRELVDLGEIALTAPVADSAGTEKGFVLLPSNVPDGIEPSDDPMIGARDEAYGVSFGRRS